MSTPLLDVRDLAVRFETRSGVVRAVEGVSFELGAGETLGIVGESGSGKSVTNLALFGLLARPPAIVSAGRAAYRGRDLLTLSERELRGVRGREVAFVFQDPMSALNPFLTVERQLTEVLEVHANATRAEARVRARDALHDVGIADPDARLRSYPHELSGGMRQRVTIAMALLCRPRILVADEPTTALDVTIQAQVLELFRRAQREHGTAILLVTHSLGVVAGNCDRVNVMYAGRVVEQGPMRAVLTAPRHPYTRGLLASVPRIDGDPAARLPSIPGAPPDPSQPSAGCAFEPRCAHRVERCARQRPELESLPGAATRSACFVSLEARAARGEDSRA